MSTLWLIGEGRAVQYLGKMKKKKRQWNKKRTHELCQLPTSLAAIANEFRKGEAYLHLKLNLAKSYKQEASPNYTQSVMET